VQADRRPASIRWIAGGLPGGKYHFNLVAGNGQVIATSEAYERKDSALNGIESVKTNAPGAETDDQTGD
jgi:uncharacterized protein